MSALLKDNDTTLPANGAILISIALTADARALLPKLSSNHNLDQLCADGRCVSPSAETATEKAAASTLPVSPSSSSSPPPHSPDTKSCSDTPTTTEVPLHNDTVNDKKPPAIIAEKVSTTQNAMSVAATSPSSASLENATLPAASTICDSPATPPPSLLSIKLENDEQQSYDTKNSVTDDKITSGNDLLLNNGLLSPERRSVSMSHCVTAPSPNSLLNEKVSLPTVTTGATHLVTDSSNASNSPGASTTATTATPATTAGIPASCASFSSYKNEEFHFDVPPEAPVFTPTLEEFANPLNYISKIRPFAEKFGICKIVPPKSWTPPFTVDVDRLRFTPRVQRLNELEAKTRVKLNFLDQIAKFWELQGSSLKIPMVERKALDLYSLYHVVHEEGGIEQTTRERKWSRVASRLGYPQGKSVGTILRGHFERILHPFDIFTNGKMNDPSGGSKVDLSPTDSPNDAKYQPHGIVSRQQVQPPEYPTARRSKRFLNFSPDTVTDNETAAETNVRLNCEDTLTETNTEDCAVVVKKEMESPSKVTAAANSAGDTSSPISRSKRRRNSHSSNSECSGDGSPVRTSTDSICSNHSSPLFYGFSESEMPTTPISFASLSSPLRSHMRSWRGGGTSCGLKRSHSNLNTGSPQQHQYSPRRKRKNQLSPTVNNVEILTQMLISDTKVNSPSQNSIMATTTTTSTTSTTNTMPTMTATGVAVSPVTPPGTTITGSNTNAAPSSVAVLGKSPNMAVNVSKHLSSLGSGSGNISSSDPLAKYVCLVCDRGDSEESMLLCDGCDDSYHTFCLMPPLADIPKGDWRCPKCVVQEVYKPLEAFGFEQAQREYTLQQFGDMADQFKADYFRMPVHMVPTELVEREFWRIVSSIDEDVTVEYGADLHSIDHGSGFPTKNSLYLLPGDQEYAESRWNLNNLPILEESILGHINADISGMKVPWMYVGMCFATFCWHNEDHWSYSINYLHWGEPKTWYGVPGGRAVAFEATMRLAAPELFQSQPDLLHQLVTIMNPNILMKAGVPVYRTDQQAGEFVITFPRAYHAGFNQGYNFAEAVNFAPADWLKMGRECINHYSLLRRPCVFSHDELVCKMALEPDRLNFGITTACYVDMTEMVDSEKKLRKALLEWGVKKAEREAFELISDDERQCFICKTTCFLSAVMCRCSNALACLRHFTELCKCQPSRYTLKYRYTLDELPLMLRRLKEKASTFENWLARCKHVLDPKTPTTQSLDDLQALLREAEDKKFPNSVLLVRLKSAVLEAEKCVTVIQQLDINRMHKRVQDQNIETDDVTGGGVVATHSSSGGYKLTMEELTLFIQEIDNLCCVIAEGASVRDLKRMGDELMERAQHLVTLGVLKSSPDDLERAINDGSALCINFPQMWKMKDLLKQVRFYKGAIEVRAQHKPPLPVIRQLIAQGFDATPEYNVERELNHLQTVQFEADEWEAEVKLVLMSGKTGDVYKLSDIEGLLRRADLIECCLPSYTKLADAVRRANSWLRTIEILERSNNYPYFDTLESLMKRARHIPFAMIELRRMQEHLNAARAWRDRTTRAFLLKHSRCTLMDVLVPRRHSVMFPGSGATSTQSSIGAPHISTGDPIPPATSLATMPSMRRAKNVSYSCGRQNNKSLSYDDSNDVDVVIEDNMYEQQKHSNEDNDDDDEEVEFNLNVDEEGYEDPGPLQVVLCYKSAEEKEMRAMNALKLANRQKNQLSDMFCVCRKRFKGTMYLCTLCSDWFHIGCVPTPRVGERSRYDTRLATKYMEILANNVRMEMGSKFTVDLTNTKPRSSAIGGGNDSGSGNTSMPPFDTLQHTKFLCPSCLRSRRPRLETILLLLVALQRLPIRLPEGEALQCLTERAMNWQDRARAALVSPEIVALLARLSHMAEAMDNLVVACESRQPDNVRNAVDELRRIYRDGQRYSAPGRRLITDSEETESEEETARSRRCDNAEDNDNTGSGDNTDNSENVGNDDNADNTGSSDNPGNTTNENLKSNQMIFLSTETRENLESLLVEGDLLEVSVDETYHIWRILNASRPNQLESNLAFIYSKFQIQNPSAGVGNSGKRKSDVGSGTQQQSPSLPHIAKHSRTAAGVAESGTSCSLTENSLDKRSLAATAEAESKSAKTTAVSSDVDDNDGESTKVDALSNSSTAAVTTAVTLVTPAATTARSRKQTLSNIRLTVSPAAYSINPIDESKSTIKSCTGFSNLTGIGSKSPDNSDEIHFSLASLKMRSRSRRARVVTTTKNGSALRRSTANASKEVSPAVTLVAGGGAETKACVTPADQLLFKSGMYFMKFSRSGNSSGGAGSGGSKGDITSTVAQAKSKRRAPKKHNVKTVASAVASLAHRSTVKGVSRCSAALARRSTANVKAIARRQLQRGVDATMKVSRSTTGSLPSKHSTIADAGTLGADSETKVKGKDEVATLPLSSHTTSATGNEDDENHEDEEEEDDDDDEDCSAIKCIKPTGREVDWVQCDGGCNKWFHMLCVGVTDSVNLDEDFYCDKCTVVKVPETGAVAAASVSAIAIEAAVDESKSATSDGGTVLTATTASSSATKKAYRCVTRVQSNRSHSDNGHTTAVNKHETDINKVNDDPCLTIPLVTSPTKTDDTQSEAGTSKAQRIRTVKNPIDENGVIRETFVESSSQGIQPTKSHSRKRASHSKQATIPVKLPFSVCEIVCLKAHDIASVANEAKRGSTMSEKAAVSSSSGSALHNSASDVSNVELDTSAAASTVLD